MSSWGQFGSSDGRIDSAHLAFVIPAPFFFVIPAQAGIQLLACALTKKELDPGLRRDDEG